MVLHISQTDVWHTARNVQDVVELVTLRKCARDQVARCQVIVTGIGSEQFMTFTNMWREQSCQQGILTL